VVAAELENLLRKAFEGEVLGETFFGCLADAAENDEQRAKLDALRHLEASTKELLRPVLERHGVPTDEDACRRTGQTLAEAAASMSWHELLATLAPATADYVAVYMQLRTLVTDDEREMVDNLVAHEAALCEFCRLELGGEGGRSVDPILALPHVP
jgi:hypothetical protein